MHDTGWVCYMCRDGTLETPILLTASSSTLAFSSLLGLLESVGHRDCKSAAGSQNVVTFTSSDLIFIKCMAVAVQQLTGCFAQVSSPVNPVGQLLVKSRYGFLTLPEGVGGPSPLLAVQPRLGKLLSRSGCKSLTRPLYLSIHLPARPCASLPSEFL